MRSGHQRFGRVACALGPFAAACLAACAAEAAEGQWRLGGQLLAASLSERGFGPGFAGRLSHGLTESIEFDATAMAALHFGGAGAEAEGGSPFSAATVLAVGLSYRWDVLRVVPHLGVGAGVYAWKGVNADLQDRRFGAPLRLGVDYLVSRNWVLDASVTAHFVAGESGLRVPWIMVGLGASHAWGW